MGSLRCRQICRVRCSRVVQSTGGGSCNRGRCCGADCSTERIAVNFCSQGGFFEIVDRLPDKLREQSNLEKPSRLGPDDCASTQTVNEQIQDRNGLSYIQGGKRLNSQVGTWLEVVLRCVPQSFLRLSHAMFAMIARHERFADGSYSSWSGQDLPIIHDHELTLNAYCSPPGPS